MCFKWKYDSFVGCVTGSNDKGALSDVGTSQRLPGNELLQDLRIVHKKNMDGTFQSVIWVKCKN